MSKKAQKVSFLTQNKLWVKTLECTEQSGKIWIPQGGERVSCSGHPSFNVNMAQKEANSRGIYAHKKLTCGFYVIPFGILDLLDKTFESVYDSTDFKTLA